MLAGTYIYINDTVNYIDPIPLSAKTHQC